MRTPGLASFIGLILATTVHIAAGQTAPAPADDSDRPCCSSAHTLA